MSSLDIRAKIMAIVMIADGKAVAISEECRLEAVRIAQRYREVCDMGILKRFTHMPEIHDMTEAFYKAYPRPIFTRPDA